MFVNGEPTWVRMNFYRKTWFDTWGHTGVSLTARVKMQNFHTCSAPTARFGLLYRNILFLYTCMQNSRLRTVYRQRKWPLLAQVRKIMALGRKIMALGCQVFHYSVKCSKHGLRGFIDAVQRRLATQMVTMLTSCWQVLSKVELRRIFDVCKWWANSSFACISAFTCSKEKYGLIH